MAAALAALTFPLVWIGGLVTTTKAGMAVPDWPNTYGYNLFLYPPSEWFFGPWDLFIEHGHRLFASLVGLVAILLVVVLFKYESRRWLRTVGLAALAAVIGQGVLGGLRVLFDERALAMIHGCTGPAFFALTIALAVFTSPAWRTQERMVPHRQARSLQRLAIATAILAYGQLVLGAALRHLPVAASPELFRGVVFFHVIIAAVLVGHAVAVAFRVRQGRFGVAAIGRLAAGLLALVLLQIGLGAGTWVAKFGWPAPLADYTWSAGYVVQAGGALQVQLTTAHVAVGSLILGAAVALAIVSLRRLAAAPCPTWSGSRPLRWEAAR